MKIFTRYTLLFILTSFVYRLSSPIKVNAQNISLSVSPPVVEILLAPNQQLSQTFFLKSNTPDSLTIIPSLHLATPSDSFGHVTLDPSPAGNIPLAISSSLPLNQPFTLGDSPLSLTLTLEGATSDLPEDTYLALSFQTVAPSTADCSHPPCPDRLNVSSAISSLILTTLAPNNIIPTHVELTSFELPLLHDTALTLPLSPTLANQSPIMLRPNLTLTVLSPRGQVVETLPLPSELILGNSSRTYTSSWTPHWSNLGPYRFRLTATTAGGSTLTESEKVVWLIPLRFLILVFFLLLLIVIITRQIRTRLLAH